MQLKLSSPNKIIFEWEVSQVILPTEIWDVIILPGHAPMVTALKPWIITLIPTWKIKNKDFITSKDWISISISKWMVFVNDQIIKIVTTLNPWTNKTERQLKEEKSKLEKKVRELRMSWSLEEIENTLNELEKINADLKLKTLE